MSNATRSQWLETLEIICTKRPDEAEAEWAWVMEQLGLGPEYFLGVHEAVRQGRWREAENPAGYLKTAARREQSRLTDSGERKPRGIRGIPGLEFAGEEITLGRDGWAGRSGGGLADDGDRLSSEEMLEQMEHRRSGGRAVRDPDGIWLSSGGHVPGTGESDEAKRRAQQAAELDIALSRGMARRKRPIRPDSSQPGPLDGYINRIKQMQEARGQEEPHVDEAPERLRVDWATWAQQAGLSDWEQRVVEYKMRGTGWTEAMRSQPDEDSRRALQAAWRKLERTGLGRLEAARKKSFPQDVREQGGNDTE